MTAVYNLARMWYFTGNSSYAQKAHDILISWANTQTSFSGIEASFDIGDYAYRFAGGADILRGTWSGWTSSDTTTVQNYFNNVLWPALGIGNANATGSQGIEPLAAAVAIAVFDDDATKLNQVLFTFTFDADSGLRNTLANGEMGDTGRDQGHSMLFQTQLAWIAEVFWKQGLDVYSLYDNRILATAEYYSRFNLPGSRPPFVAFGAPFWGVFTVIGGNPRDVLPSRMTANILYGAYVLRKGLTIPWETMLRDDESEDMDSFMFRKTADGSTATVPTVSTPAAAATVTTGLTSVDTNGCVPAGSTSYSGGVWTLTGGFNGGDLWYSSTAADTVHLSYKQLTGDFTIVARVDSVSNVGSGSAKAGIMMRDSLGSTSKRCSVAITPNTTYERCMRGWSSLAYGTNAESLSFGIAQIAYWVKMERTGNFIQTYTSINGGDWSPAGSAIFTNLPSSLYVGLFTTSMVSHTLNTAQFENVRITGGDGGYTPAPAAPFSVLADAGTSQVIVRWNESLGATSYNVKRSTTSGSGYSTIASVANTTYTDTGVANGTTYYYVVSAVNSAGESSNTSQDAATPQAAMSNAAFGGTSTASANSGTGSGGSAQGFDANAGSKWFNGNAGTTGWLEYDFGSSLTQTIKQYSIISAEDVPGRDPKSWQFQGSNDGSTWTTLDTESNQTFTYRHQKNTYPTSNTTPYRYYRLNITANNGDSTGLQLAELQLLTDQGHTIPNGTYRLLNRNSDKAFEVNSGSTSNGAPIDQWTYNGGSNQKWTFTDQGNGQYQILGVASGKAVDVAGASTADGATIDIWPWSGNNNQRWTVTPTGDGYFKLTSVNSGKEVDVSGGSTSNGANVIQWTLNGGRNQQWSISIAP